jgi:hypothetical protein
MMWSPFSSLYRMSVPMRTSYRPAMGELADLVDLGQLRHALGQVLRQLRLVGQRRVAASQASSGGGQAVGHGER